MLEALEEIGHIIPLADVEKFADGALGRPHLARAMIEHGIVESVTQAFDEYIGNGGPFSEKDHCQPLQKLLAWFTNLEESPLLPIHCIMELVMKS